MGNGKFVAPLPAQEILIAFLAFAAATLVVAAVTPYGAAVSPDSAHYLDIARHIRSGDGWVATDYDLLQYTANNPTWIDTTWPPLYPMILAVFSSDPSPASAVFPSILALASTLFLTSLVLRPIVGRWGAAFASMPLALTVPLVTIHTYAWSEQWFIAFTLAMTWSIQKYLMLLMQGKKHDPARYIWLAVLFAVLALYTRYIGIVFSLLLLAAFLTPPWHRHQLKHKVAGLATYGAAALGLILFNSIVSGDATGTSRALSAETIGMNLKDAVGAVSRFFATPSWHLLTTTAAALLATSGCYALLRNWSPGRPDRHAALADMTWKLAASASVIYAAGLLAMRSYTHFDRLDIRLLGPTMPFIWISLVAAGMHIFLTRRRRVLAVLPWMLVSSAMFNGCVTLIDAHRNLRETGQQMHGKGMFREAYRNYNPGEHANYVRTFYAETMPEGAVLVTNGPAVMSVLTGKSCLQKPHSINAEIIRALSSLPAGSLMPVRHDELETWTAELHKAGATFRLLWAGDNPFIRLPVHLEAE